MFSYSYQPFAKKKMNQPDDGSELPGVADHHHLALARHHQAEGDGKLWLCSLTSLVDEDVGEVTSGEAGGD